VTDATDSNVLHFLQRAAQRVPDRPALITDWAGRPQETSFAELWERVDRISVGLKANGFQPGERAIVMVPMSCDLYAALLGVLKMGGVAVFVDPWQRASQIAALAAYAAPSAYIGVARSHLLRLFNARLRAIPLCITTTRWLGRLPAPLTLADVEKHPGDGAIYAARPEDPALITFTSGSSGDPKGANRTHGFLTAQHQALQKELAPLDDDVDMPMFPVFALNNLAAGITSVLPRMNLRHVARVNGSVIADQIERHDVTTCTASPPFFDRLAAHVRAHVSYAPELRRIVSGGAVVMDDQLCAWSRAFGDARITIVYGSTEAEPVAQIDVDERLGAQSDVHPRTPGYCLGTPMPDIRTKLVRIQPGPIVLEDDGWAALAVPPGEIGELLVAGRHVCTDYYQNEQAVAENKVRDDAGVVWHRMGDTGYFDGQGRLWLTGRVHSTILRPDRVLHPQLVEQAAQLADARVCRAAVVDLGPPSGVVVIVRVSDTDAAIAERVRTELAAQGMPVDEVIVTTAPLPVDPRHNAKIDYNKLRKRFGGRR